MNHQTYKVDYWIRETHGEITIHAMSMIDAFDQIRKMGGVMVNQIENIRIEEV